MLWRLIVVSYFLPLGIAFGWLFSFTAHWIVQEIRTGWALALLRAGEQREREKKDFEFGKTDLSRWDVCPECRQKNDVYLGDFVYCKHPWHLQPYLDWDTDTEMGRQANESVLQYGRKLRRTLKVKY